MSDTMKLILGLAATTFLGFQGWLAAGVVQAQNTRVLVEENRRERAEQIRDLTSEHANLHEEVARLREVLADHRLRDSADDRGVAN